MSSQFLITYELYIDVDDLDALDEQFESVLDELDTAEDINDYVKEIDVSATLSRGEVEISLLITAKTLNEASDLASAVVRAAFHAAGGFTPGWEADELELEDKWLAEVISSTQKKADLAYGTSA